MNGMKCGIVSFLFILFSVSAQKNQGEEKLIYKWVENGQVNYGRFPPPTGEYVKLDSQGEEIINYRGKFDTVKISTKKEPTLKKKKKSKETPEEKQKNEMLENNCNIAQKNLESLKSEESYSKDAEGNLIKMAPEEVQTKRAQTTKDIAYFCNQ